MIDREASSLYIIMILKTHLETLNWTSLYLEKKLKLCVQMYFISIKIENQPKQIEITERKVKKKLKKLIF